MGLLILRPRENVYLYVFIYEVIFVCGNVDINKYRFKVLLLPHKRISQQNKK